jgi:NAD(P)-dependent dehydrogenase (short-subunit alcohol dehydrogenase family)
MLTNQSLPQRVALITGAAQGIGAACAQAFANSGYQLALTSRKLSQLQPIADQIEKAGGSVLTLELNINDHLNINEITQQVFKNFGRLDVLINNAGIPLRQDALAVTPAEWDTIMDTNLKGTFFLSQEVANTWVSHNTPGCIINMASLHGIVAMSGRSSYGIAKAGILQMTKMLALEWAQHNIRVNAIAPGRVETPARATTFAPDPKYREAMLNKIPLKRFCTPEQAAAAACYLASDLASIMTGQVLILDGGITTY